MLSWPQASDRVFYALCITAMRNLHACFRLTFVRLTLPLRVNSSPQLGLTSSFPTPKFYIVIRSLPAILYYFNTPSPVLWRPNDEAHSPRGLAGEPRQLSFCEHVIISMIHGNLDDCSGIFCRVLHWLFCGLVRCSALLGHHPRHEDIFSRR